MGGKAGTFGEAGAGGVFPEDVVDVAEGLFEHGGERSQAGRDEKGKRVRQSKRKNHTINARKVFHLLACLRFPFSEELFLDLRSHLPKKLIYERELLICRM